MSQHTARLCGRRGKKTGKFSEDSRDRMLRGLLGNEVPTLSVFITRPVEPGFRESSCGIWNYRPATTHWSVLAPETTLLKLRAWRNFSNQISWKTVKSKVLRLSLVLKWLFRASAQHPTLTIGEDRPVLLVVVEKTNTVNGLLSVTVFVETPSTYCLVLTVCQLKELIKYLTNKRHSFHLSSCLCSPFDDRHFTTWEFIGITGGDYWKCRLQDHTQEPWFRKSEACPGKQHLEHAPTRILIRSLGHKFGKPLTAILWILGEMSECSWIMGNKKPYTRPSPNLPPITCYDCWMKSDILSGTVLSNSPNISW